KTVKVHYEIVDSEKQDRGTGDVIMGTKQEYPDLTFTLVGDEGRNQVDLIVAKDADFNNAVLAERKKKEGGAQTAGGGAPAAGGAGAAAAAPVAEAPKVSGEGLKKAKELADAGQHAEAIQLYKEFLTKDPTGNPAVYYYLGKSLYQTGDDASAEQAFKK